MTDLDKLIAAVGAGTAKASDFRAVWRGYAGSTSVDAQNAVGAYDGSLDAALRLHEALLPGWGWVLDMMDGFTAAHVYSPRAEHFGGDHENPARAWLLSILRALKARA